MKCLLFLVVGLVSISAYSQTAQELVAEAGALKDAYRDEEALTKYEDALAKDPQNLAALIGASFQSVVVGNRKPENMQAAYFKRANNYADRALQIAPTNANANYVKSASVGRMALISGTREKIEYSKDVKKYAELALKYDPTHARAWHALGLWHYKIKELSSTKMMMVKLIYGGLPKASYADAIASFKKAIKYKPGYILYYKDLAYAYYASGDEVNAKIIALKGLALPAKTPDDPGYQQEMRELQKELE